DVLHVTGGLALAPQRAPRAGPEVRRPGPQGEVERLAVHPRHHEDLARLGLLDHGGNQAGGVPGQLGGAAHGSIRPGSPRVRMARLASATVCWPKWNMVAPRTASAPPLETASARCSSAPAPPEAITGTETASATARVRARS